MQGQGQGRGLVVAATMSAVQGRGFALVVVAAARSTRTGYLSLAPAAHPGQDGTARGGAGWRRVTDLSVSSASARLTGTFFPLGRGGAASQVDFPAKRLRQTFGTQTRRKRRAPGQTTSLCPAHEGRLLGLRGLPAPSSHLLMHQTAEHNVELHLSLDRSDYA